MYKHSPAHSFIQPTTSASRGPKGLKGTLKKRPIFRLKLYNRYSNETTRSSFRIVLSVPTMKTNEERYKKRTKEKKPLCTRFPPPTQTTKEEEEGSIRKDRNQKPI